MTRAGAFGGGAGRARAPAVIVVDLIRGFTDPACALGSPLDAEVASTRSLVDTAREHGVPVMFTTVVYDAAHAAAAAVFLRKVPALLELTPGSVWVDIDPRLAPRDDEPVLVKAHASAFFGTPLAAMLSGRDSLVVCGATTSGCVRATVVDAMQHGLIPIVPREAVGDRWPDAHAQSLHDMEQKYADVMPAGSVADLLREAAGAVHQAGEVAAEDA